MVQKSTLGANSNHTTSNDNRIFDGSLHIASSIEVVLIYTKVHQTLPIKLTFQIDSLEITRTT